MSSLSKIWNAVPASWKEYLKAALAAYLGFSYGPGASSAVKSIFATLSKFLLG
jgi:hypothetical protein